MALQGSVQVCGAQLQFNYNAGNGRATSIECTTPLPIHYRITLSNGTVIDRALTPGTYSFPLPANVVRITLAPDGEATITGIDSIGAETLP